MKAILALSQNYDYLTSKNGLLDPLHSKGSTNFNDTNGIHRFFREACTVWLCQIFQTKQIFCSFEYLTCNFFCNLL